MEEIRLPVDVEKEGAGKKIDALYQFEVLASPRGKPWYLTRRIAEEDSVACLRHNDWIKSSDNKQSVSLYLSTVFLANRARVNQNRPSLAYSMTLGIRVPDYEIDRKLWMNEHYEGGYLFHDSVVIEMIPPQNGGGDWQVTYNWQSQNAGQATKPLSTNALNNGKIELAISFASTTTPGIDGKLRFIVSKWNA